MTTLYQTIDSHIIKLRQNLNTSLIATITKVNSSGDSIQSINVQPVIDKVYTDGLRIKLPEIKNVPVLFPSGGGGILSFPIEVGDDVLIVVCQNDIDSYLSGDTSGKPNTLRKFSLTDAIAIPCIYPLGDDLKPSQDDVELKFKDSIIRIDKEGNVEVESSKDISAKAEGKVSIKTGSTFSVSNDALELISLLSDFLEDCSQITTPTIFGGTTPINNLSTFTALKSKIDTMKEG